MEMEIKQIDIAQNAILTAMLHTPNREMCGKEATRRAAMIICPGGGYGMVSKRESDPPAISFLNMGLQVFVLRYPIKENAGDKAPLEALARAIQIVRNSSEEWQIDPEKIAVCGFSAGAHLAGSLGVHWNDPEILTRCQAKKPEELRPNAMVLCYPVITAGEFSHVGSIQCVSRNCKENLDYWSLETQVDNQTPPTFLWHTMNDPEVPVENSFLFAEALHRCGVPCECHFYEKGYHGMSTATREVNAADESIHTWTALCRNWLSSHFGTLGGEAR